MKFKFIFLIALLPYCSTGQHLKPSRYYGDIGLHFGTAMLNATYSDRERRDYSFINGPYVSITVASDRYVSKTRASFFAGDRGNAYLTEFSCLLGVSYVKRWFAFDASIGAGYYNVSSTDRPQQKVNIKTVGLSHEGNLTFTPSRYFAISVFLFGGLTKASWNNAFGIKIGFGKYY